MTHSTLSHVTLAVAASLFASSLAAAQTPRLVSDLNPGSKSSDPSGLTAVGDRVFFLAEPTSSLYVSDGTSSGTKRVGTVTSLGPLVGTSTHVFAFKGRDLWVSDGTNAGTKVLKQFARVFTTGIAAQTARLGNTLFFPADDGRTGIELWKSDGTKAGTVLVKDIHPTSRSSPNLLYSDGQKIWFRAFHPTAGLEPFTTDGTTAGTKLVQDIRPGSGGSAPYGFANIGDRVVFIANNGTTGNEPFVSDARGTRLVRELSPGTRDLRPGQLAAMDGYGYFLTSADRALWRTNGTAAGTTKVATLRGSPFGRPYAAGNRLFFKTTFQTLLWSSDGTSAGTKIFSGIDTSRFFAIGDGRAGFMSAARTPTGSELWLTDGTPKGSAAYEVLKGGQSSGASWPARVGNRIFFSAYDPTNGQELRVLDNVAVGEERPSPCSSQRLYVAPPVVSRTSNFEMRGLTTNRISALVIGPVIRGGVALGSCRVWANFATGILLPYVATTSTRTIPIPIPNDSKLIGARLAAQNWQILGTNFDLSPADVLSVGH